MKINYDKLTEFDRQLIQLFNLEPGNVVVELGKGMTYHVSGHNGLRYSPAHGNTNIPLRFRRWRPGLWLPEGAPRQVSWRGALTMKQIYDRLLGSRLEMYDPKAAEAEARKMQANVGSVQPLLSAQQAMYQQAQQDAAFKDFVQKQAEVISKDIDRRALEAFNCPPASTPSPWLQSGANPSTKTTSPP